MTEQATTLGTIVAGARPSGFRCFMPHFRGKEREAQVALRWLIENDLVLPIPGAKNGRQAADNAGALTPAEIEALDRATYTWQATKGTTS